MFVSVTVSSVSWDVLALTIVIGPTAVLLVVTTHTPRPAATPPRRLECQLRHSGWATRGLPFSVVVVAAFFVSAVVFILASRRRVWGGGMAILCPLPVTLHH